MEFTEIDRVLYKPKPEDNPKNIAKWEKTNKLCIHTIKCGLSNKLFDNYCYFTCAKNLWDELNGRYGFEDEGAKKFATAKFMSFQMVEEKNVSSQIEDFQKLVSELAKERDILPEKFVTHGLVFKLPDSWKEYKYWYSHHRTYLNFQQTIVNIQIEETNRISETVYRVKEFTFKANVVEGGPSKPPQHNKKHAFKGKGNLHNKNVPNPQIQKKKGNCFICGKVGHYVASCRARSNFNNNKNNNKGSMSNKANVVQTKEIIAAVVCEAHLVTKVKGWIVDWACTRHIGAFKEEFSSYTPMAEDTECVYVGDNRSVLVSGKGKVLLKLTSHKTLSLNNVLHLIMSFIYSHSISQPHYISLLQHF